MSHAEASCTLCSRRWIHHLGNVCCITPSPPNTLVLRLQHRASRFVRKRKSHIHAALIKEFRSFVASAPSLRHIKIAAASDIVSSRTSNIKFRSKALKIIYIVLWRSDYLSFVLWNRRIGWRTADEPLRVRHPRFMFLFSSWEPNWKFSFITP